jgi:hypothetical protein
LAKYKSPDDIQIAAMQKKTVTAVDLMVSGRGLPWEDRGTIGVVPAFFKTAWAAMFRPISLVTSMRRPETAKDANIFAYGLGIVWFLVVGIQSTFAYFVFYSRYPVDQQPAGQQYAINTALEGLAAGVAAVLMPRIVTWMYYRLTSFDMTSKAPPVLVYNTITYLMGVGILALIPGGTKPWLAIAPCVAAVWMCVLLLVVGIRRLRVRVGAGIIGSIVASLGAAAVVGGAWLALWLVWVQVMGNDSFPAPPPPPPASAQQR